jgi:uncharacterized protein (DUF952 family)
LTLQGAGLPSLGPVNEPGHGEEFRFKLMADSPRERAPDAATLHLVPEDVWLAQNGQSHYQPEGFSSEGFIHCTHGRDFVVEVGNRYYGDDPRPYLVLEVDLERVAAPVVYEDEERRFPHIYGPLERHAVRRAYRVERAADGTFIAIGEPAPEDLS